MTKIDAIARDIASTVLDSLSSENLEYVLRRGYTAMGMPPTNAAKMCRRLAECQLEDAAFPRDPVAVGAGAVRRLSGELAYARDVESASLTVRVEDADEILAALRGTAEASR